MTAPAPPPPPGGPGQTITVTPDNVLQARRIIGQAAEDALERLNGLAYRMRVLPPGSDQISQASARVWNHHLVGAPDSHYQRLIEYVKSVQQLGDHLEDVARQYGITEDEIAASFQHHRRQM